MEARKKMYKKLFIPGPSHVTDEMLQHMATPMIGHRAKDYVNLHAEAVPKLQKLLYTEGLVFLFAASSTGVMEGTVRQCVGRKCLNCVCGAFSDRWHGITKANGIPCDKLPVEMGQAITPEMIDEKLKTGEYDAITLVHNETSTGVMNPLYETAEVMRKYPDVQFLVDAVSSMAGVKIEVDKLGIDVCLAGVQKCFGLPPGLTVCSVSEKAMAKSADAKDKGYYFDFHVMKKYHDKHQTPATPAISMIFALNAQLDKMFVEGLDQRFQRHTDMAEYIRGWGRKHFAIFPDGKYLSNTLTTITNTTGFSVADMNAELGKRGGMISNGYGDLKEKTFRIAHMGDLTLEDMKWVTAEIEDILKLS